MQLVRSGGGFQFVPVDGPYSAGVVAEPGHAIVRVRAPRHTALADGFRLVEKTLAAAGRPRTALCAMELRVPRPLTRAGFDDFNRPYIAEMERLGAVVEGRVAAARTNVAPELDPPSEPTVHAFCFAIPSSVTQRTFVVSGVPERLGTGGGPAAWWNDIVATLEERMAALGVGWDDATETQLYAPRRDHAVFAAAALDRLAELSRSGIRWFHSSPPIDDLRMEIDVRALAEDRTVS